MNNGWEVQFLCGDHGKAFGQVKSHLVTKDGFGSRARSVAFVGPFLQDVSHQVQVSVHTSTRPKAVKEALRPSSIGSCKRWEKQEVAWRAWFGCVIQDVLSVDFIEQDLGMESNIFNLHPFTGVAPSSEPAQHVNGRMSDSPLQSLPYVTNFTDVLGCQLDDAKFEST